MSFLKTWDPTTYFIEALAGPRSVLLLSLVRRSCPLSYGTIGRSIVGFLGRNWNGRSEKVCHMTGICGQSSGRGTWWKPTVYQATMSVFMMLRFFFTHSVSPSVPLLPI